MYSRKTNQSNSNSVDNQGVDKKSTPYTVTVEFILVGNATTPLSAEECKMLEQAAESIRTAARIVDTPCNEMNTDHFLQVNVCQKPLDEFILT